MQTSRAVLFIRARHVGPDERAVIEAQISAQRDAGQKLADSLRTDIVTEYIEHGGTDRLERRPIVQRMLAELGQARSIDYVITYHADRLARRTADLTAINQSIETAGARLLFAAG